MNTSSLFGEEEDNSRMMSNHNNTSSSPVLENPLHSGNNKDIIHSTDHKTNIDENQSQLNNTTHSILDDYLLERRTAEEFIAVERAELSSGNNSELLSSSRSNNMNANHNNNIKQDHQVQRNEIAIGLNGKIGNYHKDNDRVESNSSLNENSSRNYSYTNHNTYNNHHRNMSMHNDYTRRNSLFLAGQFDDDNQLLDSSLRGRTGNSNDFVPFEKRSSLDLLGEAAANIDLQNKWKNTNHSSIVSRSNSLGQSNDAFLAVLANIESPSLRADVDQARRQQASLQLALQGNINLSNNRNSLELDIAQRKSSLEFLQKRNSLDLLQRRSSSDWFSSHNDENRLHNNFDHHDALALAALFETQRRNSLETAFRRNSLDQVNSVERRGSLTNPLNANQLETIFDDIFTTTYQRTNHNDSMLNQLSQSEIDAMKQFPARYHNIHDHQMTLIDSADSLNKKLGLILNSFHSLQKMMQKSFESQQIIQKWDKKMGLKRSHSSTMTKTDRSRKKLRRLIDTDKKLLEESLRDLDFQKQGGDSLKQL